MVRGKVYSGKDSDNKDFEVPYLFIVPEKNISIGELLVKVNNLIKEELSLEEKPKDVFVINEKPISKFKVDRKVLQKKYNLV